MNRILIFTHIYVHGCRDRVTDTQSGRGVLRHGQVIVNEETSGLVGT